MHARQVESEHPRSTLRAVARVIAATCLIALLGTALIAAISAVEAHSSTDEHLVLIIVPKGSAFLQASGSDAPMLPQLLTLRVGELDTLVIRNDDHFPVRVGPIRLAQGQQYRQRFRAAGDVQLICATMYHKEQIIVRVLPLRDGPLAWVRNQLNR